MFLYGTILGGVSIRNLAALSMTARERLRRNAVRIK